MPEVKRHVQTLSYARGWTEERSYSAEVCENGVVGG